MSMLISHSVERNGTLTTEMTVMDGTEKYRLNHEYLGVKLAMLDDGWNKNGDREGRLLTSTAEWLWDHKLTYKDSTRLRC